MQSVLVLVQKLLDLLKWLVCNGSSFEIEIDFFKLVELLKLCEKWLKSFVGDVFTVSDIEIKNLQPFYYILSSYLILSYYLKMFILQKILVLSTKPEYSHLILMKNTFKKPFEVFFPQLLFYIEFYGYFCKEICLVKILK